ncbi:MAG: hypothetical protein AB7G88_08575 [Thermomicrobiales bacterium]
MTDLRDTLTQWFRVACGMPVLPATPYLTAIGTVERHAAHRSMQPHADEGVSSFADAGKGELSRPLSVEEQRARVIALRGMSQAREGDFAAAEETFAEAVDLDPELDLRRLPAFWHLPRQVHEAAIGALLSAGRSRDASALIADLKTRYRPRLLPVRSDD